MENSVRGQAGTPEGAAGGEQKKSWRKGSKDSRKLYGRCRQNPPHFGCFEELENKFNFDEGQCYYNGCTLLCISDDGVKGTPQD